MIFDGNLTHFILAANRAVSKRAKQVRRTVGMGESVAGIFPDSVRRHGRPGWFEQKKHPISRFLLLVSYDLMICEVFTYNHSHNIMKLFDVLPNFPFTTKETMRHYYL